MEWGGWGGGNERGSGGDDVVTDGVAKRVRMDHHEREMEIFRKLPQKKFSVNNIYLFIY